MKNSGIEWIGMIPKEWKVQRVKNGFFRKNDKAMQSNPVVLSLSRSGVKRRDLSRNEGQIAESYFNYNPVDIDDLMINPMDLYSGANCSISKTSGVISPAYINLRYKNGYNPTYYDYYFKTQYWTMALFVHGKGVSYDNRWTLSIDTLLNYYIPYPSLSEQTKIANYLDKKVNEIDKTIDKTKESIEEYKKLKQSIITNAVTKGLNPNVEIKDSQVEWIEKIPAHWKINWLKRYFSFSKGLPITKIDLIKTGLPVVSYGQIHSKINSGVHLHQELIRYVDYSYEKSNPISRAKIGSILMADTSEDIQGCGNCVYNDENENLFAGYHTIILSNMEYDNSYFAYLFLTDTWRQQIRSRVYGVKLFSITQGILKECSIIIPPVEERKQIVNYLNKKCIEIDNIILKQNEIIKELEKYKKSLIYEYVTGKKEVK